MICSTCEIKVKIKQTMLITLPLTYLKLIIFYYFLLFILYNFPEVYHFIVHDNIVVTILLPI